MFKPAGPTLDAVRARACGACFAPPGGRKLPVGHLGTLDPDAAGVLPLALGKATRLIPLIEDRRKAYAFTLVLGRATATGDASGATVREAPCPPMPKRCCAPRRRAFVGRDRASAADVQRGASRGQAAVRARARGRQSSSARRARSRSTRLRVLGVRRQRTARMRVACSEGTYVRTLCEDLGDAVGTVGAHGRAAARSVGPVRALREPAARRDRGAPAASAGLARARDPVSDDRARRARAPPTSARAGSCRCRTGAATATCSCAIRRARSSASAKPSARCSRRARFSCEDPSRARARRTRARRSCSRSDFSTACTAAIARSCARCCACGAPASARACSPSRTIPRRILRPGQRAAADHDARRAGRRCSRDAGIDELYLVPFDARDRDADAADAFRATTC